ncbi:unnamed protein product [Rotaria sp. Silwood2]|nr:unnamed protein product [Rotaria sp. Silwood2]
MMWRNGLKHSYRSINSNGIIVSDFIDEISPIEVIVKRYCQGTDKNSYYDILENENIVLPNSNGEYLCGPYVRLDWRNPNHISPKTRKSLNENPYYYIYEQAVGKEEFFNKILANKLCAIPFVDKNITEDLVTHLIDVKQPKLSALKMFMIIQSILIEYFTKNKFHQTELSTYNSYFYTDEIGKLLMNTQLNIPTNLQELWLMIRDRFAEEQLEIKIIRQSGRSLCVKGEIIDQNKFCKYFDHDENIKLSLFPSKPKDMPWLLASKRVIHLVTFETVVKNYPTVYIILHEVADPNICLALLCRKGACIEPKKSTHQNKSLIAAEHVSHVTRFFEQININPSTYHLDRVTGSSEGYLVNTDLYLLADAIVESYLTKTTNTHCTLWNGVVKR